MMILDKRLVAGLVASFALYWFTLMVCTDNALVVGLVALIGAIVAQVVVDHLAHNQVNEYDSKPLPPEPVEESNEPAHQGVEEVVHVVKEKVEEIKETEEIKEPEKIVEPEMAREKEHISESETSQEPQTIREPYEKMEKQQDCLQETKQIEEPQMSDQMEESEQFKEQEPPKEPKVPRVGSSEVIDDEDLSTDAQDDRMDDELKREMLESAMEHQLIPDNSVLMANNEKHVDVSDLVDPASLPQSTPAHIPHEEQGSTSIIEAPTSMMEAPTGMMDTASSLIESSSNILNKARIEEDTDLSSAKKMLNDSIEPSDSSDQTSFDNFDNVVREQAMNNEFMQSTPRDLADVAEAEARQEPRDSHAVFDLQNQGKDLLTSSVQDSDHNKASDLATSNTFESAQMTEEDPLGPAQSLGSGILPQSNKSDQGHVEAKVEDPLESDSTSTHDIASFNEPLIPAHVESSNSTNMESDTIVAQSTGVSDPSVEAHSEKLIDVSSNEPNVQGDEQQQREANTYPTPSAHQLLDLERNVEITSDLLKDLNTNEEKDTKTIEENSKEESKKNEDAIDLLKDASTEQLVDLDEQPMAMTTSEKKVGFGEKLDENDSKLSVENVFAAVNKSGSNVALDLREKKVFGEDGSIDMSSRGGSIGAFLDVMGESGSGKALDPSADDVSHRAVFGDDNEQDEEDLDDNNAETNIEFDESDPSVQEAATRIQAAFKGYRVRNATKEMLASKQGSG